MQTLETDAFFMNWGRVYWNEFEAFAHTKKGFQYGSKWLAILSKAFVKIYKMGVALWGAEGL